MKIYKIAIIVSAVSIASIYGISKSHGNIGGPGQNMCLHNGEAYAVASGATSNTCPGVPDGLHPNAEPPHLYGSDPECKVEVTPLL